MKDGVSDKVNDMRYDEHRRRRWLAGRQERGLPHDAPFQGEPLAEFMEEICDAGNYLQEAAAVYDIPEAVIRRALGELQGFYIMAETMKQER